MPGLSLGVMGNVRASSTSGTSGSTSAPTTASEAGFGPQPSGMPTAREALAPNDPFGLAFWAGVACLGLLILVRHSLPA